MRPSSQDLRVLPQNILLIGGNLVPLLGVLLWNWSLFDIFYLYWAENVLIGGITGLRMLMVGAAWGISVLFGTLFNLAFFALHYGIFCLAHGMILFEIFYKGPLNPNKEMSDLLLYMFLPGNAALLWAMTGLLVAGVVRTLKDMREDRIQARLPINIMMAPYGRIIVLHIAILIGGLLAQKIGSPVWALAVLVLLKIVYDLAAYNHIADGKGKDLPSASIPSRSE